MVQWQGLLVQMRRHFPRCEVPSHYWPPRVPDWSAGWLVDAASAPPSLQGRPEWHILKQREEEGKYTVHARNKRNFHTRHDKIVFSLLPLTGT